MRTLICTLCFFVFISSCKKDISKARVPGLTGQWNWVAQYLGAPANTQTPQSTGINEVLTFNENKTWTKTQNGVIVSSGSFKQTSKVKRYTYLDSGYNYTVNTLHFFRNDNQEDSTIDYEVTDTILRFGNFDPAIFGAGTRVYSK